jgi:hypothetical protein
MRLETREVAVALAAMAREHGVRARFAYDGLRMAMLRPTS